MTGEFPPLESCSLKTEPEKLIFPTCIWGASSVHQTQPCKVLFTSEQGEEAGTPGNHVKTRMRAEATGFGGSTGGGWVSMSLQLVSFSDYTSWAAAVGSLLKVPWGGLGIVSGPVASKPPSLVLLEISNILLQIYFRLK